MKKFNDPSNGFIQGFKALRALPLNLNQTCLLEYILSYTARGQKFYDSSQNISFYLKMTKDSTKNLISKMEELGYIICERVGIAGAKDYRRYITVDQDFINYQLYGNTTVSDEPEYEVSPIKFDPTPEIIVVESPKEVEASLHESLVNPTAPIPFEERVDEQEDNEFAKQMAAAEGKTTSSNETIQYKYECMIELLESMDETDTYRIMVENRFGSIQSATTDYLNGLYHYQLPKTKLTMEIYNAIYSNKYAA